MTTDTQSSDWFYGVLACVAMFGPIGIVIAAGSMPETAATGDFVVDSYGVLLACITVGMLLRASYVLGREAGRIKMADWTVARA